MPSAWSKITWVQSLRGERPCCADAAAVAALVPTSRCTASLVSMCQIFWSRELEDHTGRQVGKHKHVRGRHTAYVYLVRTPRGPHFGSMRRSRGVPRCGPGKERDWIRELTRWRPYSRGLYARIQLCASFASCLLGQRRSDSSRASYSLDKGRRSIMRP